VAQKISVPMPFQLDMAPNYTLRIAALDPTTGAPVAGVTIGKVVVTADGDAGTLDLTNVPNPILLGVDV